MAFFIMAMTINPGAKKQHSDLQAQVNKSFEYFKVHGAKVKEIFATLGRYDYLAVFEADDQTIAFKVASEINNKGILETETWPVVPLDDFTRLLPS